ncbi:hypothetical protein GAMM_40192 [Gammaproteobacteria bacterium]
MNKFVELSEKEIISVTGGFFYTALYFSVGMLLGGILLKVLTNTSDKIAYYVGVGEKRTLECIEECMLPYVGEKKK